ncbi:hypothetical protein BD410DRAFT_824755 [Rickenella mellea]|uniref:Uncharacterized protein n=1 Tax=Rickenella mellea TaxID=50990 RepID=A0A4Y7QKV8_9AGAM|nr:hypothetical protein BD410DRAFT_824755 [Rickenella mellea]
MCGERSNFTGTCVFPGSSLGHNYPRGLSIRVKRRMRNFESYTTLVVTAFGQSTALTSDDNISESLFGPFILLTARVAASLDRSASHPIRFHDGETQLLEKLGYSAHDHPDQLDVLSYSNRTLRTKEENEEIRLLDTIAVCLSTGNLGNVVATSFETGTEGTTLYIARNVPATAKEKEFAGEFLREISNKESTIEKVLDVILKGNIEIIRRRLGKLVECLDYLNFPKQLREYGKSEEFVPETEFGKPYTLEIVCQKLGLAKKDDKTVKHTVEILSALYNAIKSLAKSIQAAPQARDLLRLDGICDVLLKSRFMLTPSPELERLDRRLNKVCQCISGVEVLLNAMKKRTNEGKKIEMIWVPNPEDKPGSVTVGELEAAIKAVVPNGDNTNIKRLAERYAPIWKKTVWPKMHCEIQIAVVLDKKRTSGSKTHRATYAIGCSKRSCLLCILWLEVFSTKIGARYWTSGSHGKPYSAWVLPIYGPSEVRQELCKNIHQRASRFIEWRLTGGSAHDRKYSEDYRSGSGSDDDIHLRNFMGSGGGSK